MSRTRTPGSIISAIRRRSRRSSSGAAEELAGAASGVPKRSAALRSAMSAPEAGQAAMLGAAGQEAAQGREQLRLVQQKSVVTLVGLDLDKADIGGHRIQRMHQGAALRSRKQPIAGEGDDAEAWLRAREGGRQRPFMLGGEVEIIHRPRDVEIGVGVEPVDEGAALMAQIALDLEIGVETVGNRVAVLQVAAEFAVQC